MKSRIEYRIGNRRVSQREWQRNLIEAPKKQIKDEIARRLRAMRCPEHGQSPQVIVRERGSEMTWELSACCERLVEQATRELR